MPFAIREELLRQHDRARFANESKRIIGAFEDEVVGLTDAAPSSPAPTPAPAPAEAPEAAQAVQPASPRIDPSSWLPTEDELTATWRQPATGQSGPGAAPESPSPAASDDAKTSNWSLSDISAPQSIAERVAAWLPTEESLTQVWQDLLPKPKPASGTPSPMPTAPRPRLSTGEELGEITIEDGRTTPRQGLPPGGQVVRVPSPQRQPAVLDYSSPEALRQSLVDSAQVVADKYDLPASIIAAIPIQEGGFVGSRLSREGNNLFSIKGEGPAGSMVFTEGAAPEDLNTPFRKYNTAAESFDDFGRLITTQPRYAQAVEVWRETRDPARFLEEVQKAGYATDWGDADGTGVPWWQKVVNISKDLPAPQASAAPAERPTAAADRPSPVQGVADGPDWRKTWGENLTPDQIQETLALGMSWDDAIATCGIAAAVAFARANGGEPPTFGQALQLAQETGEWNADVGMTRGSTGQVALLKRLGVTATAGPVNEEQIARTVQRGQPVQINAHGNGGHFYVAQEYDPETGRFNFGNSAAILKRSGGRTWFRLDELADLGVGSPSEAIYLGSR